MKYEHLVGITFDMERRNCYQLLRDFYHDNYNIPLTDYACPHDWWEKGLDLFNGLAEDEGFELINLHPRLWKPGDVVIMAIQSSRGNHCGIILDNGKLLHHLVGQLSTVTPYGGMFRNCTVAVYRHKQVPQDLQEDPVDIKEFLPIHVRRQLERRLAEQTPTGS